MSLLSIGNLWLLLMVELSGSIGIYMGMEYPFPMYMKALMIIGIIASGVFVYLGFKNHKRTSGQIMAVSGVVLWFFVGLIGLGTGT